MCVCAKHQLRWKHFPDDAFDLRNAKHFFIIYVICSSTASNPHPGETQVSKWVPPTPKPFECKCQSRCCGCSVPSSHCHIAPFSAQDGGVRNIKVKCLNITAKGVMIDAIKPSFEEHPCSTSFASSTCPPAPPHDLCIYTVCRGDPC